MPPAPSPPKKKKNLKETIDSAIIAGGEFLNDPSGKNRAAQAEREKLIEEQRVAATTAQEAPITAPPVEASKPEDFVDDSDFFIDRQKALAAIKRAQQNTPKAALEQAGAQVSAINQQKRLEQEQATQQAQNLSLLEQARQGLLTPEQLAQVQGASPDIGQALGAGLLGAGPGFAGGLATAGAASLVAGGTAAASTAFLGPGALAVGAAAALGTFLFSVRNNIASQQAEEFAADQQVLLKGDKYLRSLITDTNRNPQNAAQNIVLFYQTLNMISIAHAKTWQDSQENLNRFLGKDATKELAKFEVFDSTMKNYYIQQFNTAVGAPNPNVNLITIEDLQEPLE